MRINRKFSEWAKVTSGIPQGSVLGTLLFLLNIWDLNITNFEDPKILSKIYKYVDDTKVVSRVAKEEDYEEKQRLREHEVE